jgi:hypothetical protein
MTVSNIVIEEKQAEPTPDPEEPEIPVNPSVSYEITYASKKSEVLNNPGTWYYYCVGTSGTDYELAAAPTYNDGTITFAFNKMAAMSTNPNYQVRYQPVLSEGVTSYTVTFTVEFSAPGKVHYGINNKNSKTFNEAGTMTLTCECTVDGTNSFAINVRATNNEEPITMTISNITFTEISAN